MRKELEKEYLIYITKLNGNVWKDNLFKER